MLGLLQHLFDEVSVQVLVSGAVSDGFWPGTGVLQGSILSPFLYSVYINSLPAVLRAPFSPRVVERPPRLYNGLWINSLMYADDVVLIGTAESMPLLLARVEAHSVSLGYRWNPLKSVVLNVGVGGGATGVSPGLCAGVSLFLYG
ncbi:Amino_oxidase domain-containing protein [Mucor velutinosus]|uniref:Amino_oxidase domain-containing protein n=1 Tax=Mucor velutinosus TaxID=708070 RepID=A0AAN7HYW8_9FUNG|nr:Amino_oxidase domain-containing protein [Mucor velutinosus]